MVGSDFSFDDHVVYLNLHVPTQLWLENFSYTPLEGCSNILQPKGHHPVTICSKGCYERCVYLVLWVHLYLVVAGESIHEAQKLMTRGAVYELVHPGKWETIFWTCFI